jgi:hypothetical protein
MSYLNMPRFFRRNIWISFLLFGIIGFLLVWFFLPHKSEIDSVWQLIFKLGVFFLVVFSIAFFPNQAKSGYLFVILPFFVFTGFLIPKLSFYGFTGSVVTNNLYGEFYTLLYLLLYPSIILTTCLAYRIGGGSPGNCIKIALSGVLILFSGFLDLLWYVVNPVKLPEIIQYAHHIKLILGHYPTYQEAIFFALAHLPVFVVILLLPLNQWIDKIITIETPTKNQTNINM